HQRDIDAGLQSFSVDRTFALYLCCAIFASAVPFLTWRVLPLAQILLALASLRWVFYILLGYVTLRRRSKVGYFAIASVLEFVSGVGFFAEFKTVFFVLALVILGVRARLNLRM